MKVDRATRGRRELTPEYKRTVASLAQKAEDLVADIQREALAIFQRAYSPEAPGSDLDVNSELLALQAKLERMVKALEAPLHRAAVEVKQRDRTTLQRHLERAGLEGLGRRLDAKLNVVRRDVQALENLLANASEDETEKLFRSFVDNNVQKITSVSGGALDEMRELVSHGFRSGMPTNKLSKQIEKRFGVAKSRAKLIARDQVGKLQGELNRVRQKEVGVHEYIWRTSQDERVRDSHAALDGQKFSWNQPPSVGHPGEDYQCRCYAEPVLETVGTPDEPEAVPFEQPPAPTPGGRP